MSAESVGYKATLAGLLEERARLDKRQQSIANQLQALNAAIKIFEARVAGVPVPEVAKTEQLSLPKDTTIGQLIMQEIIEKDDPAKVHKTIDIAMSLKELGVSSDSKSFYNSVYVALSGLVEKGLLKKDGTGFRFALKKA